MPESMRTDVFGYTSEQGVPGYNALYAARRQPVIITRQINLFAAAIANKKRFSRIRALAYIPLQPISCRRTYENRTVFLPFAAHHKLAALKIYVVSIQSHQFRNSQS